MVALAVGCVWGSEVYVTCEGALSSDDDYWLVVIS